MDIRLIKTEDDYEEALAEVKRLWDAPTSSPERDKLEVLAMLMHRYEREREPLPTLSPIEAIKFRMEQRGLARKDLLPIFRTTGRVSEILAGHRPLTLDMIRKLNSYLDIPLESLVQPTSRAPSQKPRTARTRSSSHSEQKARRTSARASRGGAQ